MGRRKSSGFLNAGAALGAALVILTVSSVASAYGYSVSTYSQSAADVRDVKNNPSPGNLHIYLTPVHLHWGRVLAVGGGAGFDWEFTRNFAVRANGYYPYYIMDQDDRESVWWRAEGGFRLHISEDKVFNDDIDVHSSSSSTYVGDYVLTQSSRQWVTRAARHRVTHGLNAGVITQRSPAEAEIAEQTVYPSMTEVTVYAGYAYTDSMERSVYVGGYGYRSKAYFQMIYADLLFAAARAWEVDPDDEPGRFGFRAGIEGSYGEDVGYGTRAEFGLNPGKAQGWYFSLNFSLALNVFVGK